MDLSIVAPIAGLSALAFAGYLEWSILKRETGNHSHEGDLRRVSRDTLKGEN